MSNPSQKKNSKWISKKKFKISKPKPGRTWIHPVLGPIPVPAGGRVLVLVFGQVLVPVLTLFFSKFRTSGLGVW
jgi:hypothetical protein